MALNTPTAAEIDSQVPPTLRLTRPGTNNFAWRRSRRYAVLAAGTATDGAVRGGINSGGPGGVARAESRVGPTKIEGVITL